MMNVIKALPEVKKIVTLRTMRLSPNDVLVGIEVNLVDGLDTDKIENVTDKIEEAVMKIIPKSKSEFIYVEIQS